MKISPQIKNSIECLRQQAKYVEEYVSSKLREACNEKQWLYISRVKEDESFAQKLETGRYKSILDIDDIFACTIVVKDIKEISVAETLIEEKFNIVTRKPENSTETTLYPENFNYDSLRIYCKLKQNSQEKDYYNLTFEVQIKTFLEHAWAIATHDFAYKTDNVSWSKERIVSQLKAMLDNIELTINEFDQLANSKHICKQHKKYRRLNEIIAFYKEFWDIDKLPKDIKRLANNTNELINNLGIEIQEMRKILELENVQKRGSNTLSLSPYQIIIQSIINQKKEKIIKFLRSKNTKHKNLYLLITPNMNVTEDVTNSKQLIKLLGLSTVKESGLK